VRACTPGFQTYTIHDDCDIGDWEFVRISSIDEEDILAAGARVHVSEIQSMASQANNVEARRWDALLLVLGEQYGNVGDRALLGLVGY